MNKKKFKRAPMLRFSFKGTPRRASEYTPEERQDAERSREIVVEMKRKRAEAEAALEAPPSKDDLQPQ